MSQRKVFIRGTGIVSSIGVGKPATTESIRGRRDGLKPLTLFPHPAAAGYPACSVPEFPAEEDHRCDEMAMAAIDEALSEAGITRGSDELRDCALLLGNTTVDLLAREGRARSCVADGRDYPPTIFGTGGGIVGRMAVRLAGRIGIGGPVLAYATSCSASANAICQGAQLLRTDRVRRVLAVGVDSLTATSFYGFAALALLDPEGCRPFDRDRRGIQMGEGAGAVLLDCEGSGQPDNVPLLLSAVNAFDPYHPTASSPDGSAGAQAIRSAMERAGVGPREIEGIKAHGTGSTNNDLAEVRALSTAFPDAIPPFTSLKRYVGHTMAASGAVELVAFLGCVQSGFIPASHGYSARDPQLDAAPLTEHAATSGGLFLFNSFGFGGNCVSMILRAGAAP